MPALSLVQTWLLRIFRNEFASAVLVMSGILSLYVAVYAKPLFSEEFTFGGDSFVLWSFNYLILYSIKFLGALPWWDPTSVGGHPLYFHFISGLNNILSPYYLPSLMTFKVLNYFSDISINSYIVFHRTIYVNVLNMIAVYLISRELILHRMARFFPVTVYSFSYFQLMNFHDYYIFEAMTPSLFFIFALVRFNNKRTAANLLLLLLFLALAVASLDIGIMISAFYWTALFTVLLIVFNTGILGDIRRLLSDLLLTLRGRIIIAFIVLTILSGLISAWLPLHYNSGHELRYRGGTDGTQAMQYDSSGSLTNDQIPIESSQIVSLLLHWLPSPELHDYLIQLFHHGHENRYIGLATIPLILAVLTLHLRNTYVYIFFLAYFICNAFLIYTSQNIVYKILTDNSEIFRNIRNMSTMFPRGGPPLFLVFLAGMGLDRLIISRPVEIPGTKGDESFERFFMRTLILLIIIACILCLTGFLHSSSPAFSLTKTSFLRIGILLAVFSGLCLLMPSSGKIVRTALLACLFIALYLDLTMAGQAFIVNRHNAPANDPGHHITIPYRELSELGMTIPESTIFKPAGSVAEGMFPLQYNGAYHKGIYSSSKEWLVLVSRPEGRTFLPNWTMEHQGKMTRYPDFRFFSNGYYLPFEKIRELDTDKSIYYVEPLFYLHDRELVASNKADPRDPVNGNYMIEEYTPTKVVMRTRTDRDGFLHFLDNYDRFWSASVDGRSVTIHRSNFTFKAIELPAGDHSVAWIYNPWPIKIAYSIFYLLLLIVSALIISTMIFSQES